jgi:3-oxoacyl-(acyl-carrier-protein) synthase
LNMALTRFCEAHGTGTAVGDPIESMAIGSAFREFRTPSNPLIVYVIKSCEEFTMPLICLLLQKIEN